MTTALNAFDNGLHFRKGERLILLIMGERYLVSVLDVEPERVRVSYPAAHFPVEGMYVLMEFHDDEGYSTYESEVLATPHQPGDGLVLRRPHADRRASHRRAWRVEADFKAIIKDHVHPQKHEVDVINVSAGGLQFATQQVMEIGHNLDIDFDIPGRGHHKVLAAVAHLIVLEKDQHAPHRVGVKFINPEPETTKAVAEYIWLQVHRKHPEARHPMLRPSAS
jgi:hypothetical protein